jgi:hypothetical protein
MRKKMIIGIHGIGNKPPEKVLKKWWRKSIDDGLKAIGCDNTNYDFDLVYWADYLHCEPLDPEQKDNKHPLYVKRPYVSAKDRPAIWKPSNFRKKILDKIEKKLDKIFFEDHIFINYDSIADLIIRKLFADLDIYYHKKCISKLEDVPANNAIRMELAKMLRKHRNKDILFLTHSMGSIIAYDVMTLMVPDIKIKTFVTMGSPLGLPVIIKKILKEREVDYRISNKAAVPENIIGRWYNFADLKDRIAMNYGLNDDFHENSLGILPQDTIVRNMYEYDGIKNPHKEYGYIRTPEVSTVICEFLTRKKDNIFVSAGNFIKKIFQARS